MDKIQWHTPDEKPEANKPNDPCSVRVLGVYTEVDLVTGLPLNDILFYSFSGIWLTERGNVKSDFLWTYLPQPTKEDFKLLDK